MTDDIRHIKNDYLQPFFFYLIFVVSVIPGVFAGAFIVLPWFAVSLIMLIKRRTDLLIILYVLWNLCNQGFYHYGMLGPSFDHPVLKAFNPFLFVVMLFSFLLDKKNALGDIKKTFFWLLVLAAVCAFSAVINNVATLDILKYFFVYYRWLVLAVILLKLDYPLKYYEILFNILVIVFCINSVFGVLQQFVLPVQSTPDGYIPSYEDLASGLMGAANGQTLTVICMALASFYILRYLTNSGKFNLFFIILLMMQPFSSSSKAAIVIMFACLGLSVLIISLNGKFLARIFNVSLFIKALVIAVVALIGFSVYSYTNRGFTTGGSAMVDPMKEQFEDIGFDVNEMTKIQGYITAWEVVAPSGKMGMWLGVGPTQFLFYRGVGDKTKYTKELLFKYGDEDDGMNFSSVDKQDTEIVALLGEIGILGLIIFLIVAFRVYAKLINLYKKAKVNDNKLFLLNASQYLLAIIFYSFYNTGWFSVFFYIPLWILIAYAYRWSQETTTENNYALHRSTSV